MENEYDAKRRRIKDIDTLVEFFEELVKEDDSEIFREMLDYCKKRQVEIVLS